MIDKKIEKDVAEEFEALKRELQTHLDGNSDISQTREFLQTHVSKEIVYKSEVLLDTLINYLMEDARKQIESADSEVQNAFYDADFRKRIREWATQKERLYLKPSTVIYSTDPRLKDGLIASGLTFIAGTGISIALTSNDFKRTFAIAGVILLSAFAFKFAWDKASQKSREMMKRDIYEYLGKVQKQVLKWLIEVEKHFKAEFRKFCMDNGIECGGELNNG